MSREFTVEETRGAFINRLFDYIDHWEYIKIGEEKQIEGLAHSVMALLDGSNVVFPKLVVAPAGEKGQISQNNSLLVRCQITDNITKLFKDNRTTQDPNLVSEKSFDEGENSNPFGYRVLNAEDL